MGCKGNQNWSIQAPPLNAIPPEQFNLSKIQFPHLLTGDSSSLEVVERSWNNDLNVKHWHTKGAPELIKAAAAVVGISGNNSGSSNSN